MSYSKPYVMTDVATSTASSIPTDRCGCMHLPSHAGCLGCPSSSEQPTRLRIATWTKICPAGTFEPEKRDFEATADSMLSTAFNLAFVIAVIWTGAMTFFSLTAPEARKEMFEVSFNARFAARCINHHADYFIWSSRSRLLPFNQSSSSYREEAYLSSHHALYKATFGDVPAPEGFRRACCNPDGAYVIGNGFVSWPEAHSKCTWQALVPTLPHVHGYAYWNFRTDETNELYQLSRWGYLTRDLEKQADFSWSHASQDLLTGLGMIVGAGILATLGGCLRVWNPMLAVVAGVVSILCGIASYFPTLIALDKTESRVDHMNAAFSSNSYNESKYIAHDVLLTATGIAVSAGVVLYGIVLVGRRICRRCANRTAIHTNFTLVNSCDQLFRAVAKHRAPAPSVLQPSNDNSQTQVMTCEEFNQLMYDLLHIAPLSPDSFESLLVRSRCECLLIQADCHRREYDGPDAQRLERPFKFALLPEGFGRLLKKVDQSSYLKSPTFALNWDHCRRCVQDLHTAQQKEDDNGQSLHRPQVLAVEL